MSKNKFNRNWLTNTNMTVNFKNVIQTINLAKGRVWFLIPPIFSKRIGIKNRPTNVNSSIPILWQTRQAPSIGHGTNGSVRLWSILIFACSKQHGSDCDTYLKLGLIPLEVQIYHGCHDFLAYSTRYFLE